MTPPIATTSSVDESATNDLELTDSMRAHWAKCQARAERYEEEVSLTVEEMGRTLRYFEWKRSWWLSLHSEREKSNTPPPASVQRGLRAYARRQANMYNTLITSFATQWRKSLVSRNLQPVWLPQYAAVAENPNSTPPPSLQSPNDDTGAPLTDEMDTRDDNDNNDNNDNDDNDDDDDGNNNDDEYVVDYAEVFDFDLDDEFMA